MHWYFFSETKNGFCERMYCINILLPLQPLFSLFPQSLPTPPPQALRPLELLLCFLVVVTGHPSSKREGSVGLRSPLQCWRWLRVLVRAMGGVGVG